jgi:hypothetical protein
MFWNDLIVGSLSDWRIAGARSGVLSGKRRSCGRPFRRTIPRDVWRVYGSRQAMTAVVTDGVVQLVEGWCSHSNASFIAATALYILDSCCWLLPSRIGLSSLDVDSLQAQVLTFTTPPHTSRLWKGANPALHNCTVSPPCSDC